MNEIMNDINDKRPFPLHEQSFAKKWPLRRTKFSNLSKVSSYERGLLIVNFKIEPELYDRAAYVNFNPKREVPFETCIQCKWHA